MAKKKLDPNDNFINVHIGLRIKLRRDMLGLTQKQLAAACGVSFQQIQKYEKGETRIVAARLIMLGRVLDVPVSFLFAGLPKQTPASEFISAAPSSDTEGVHAPDGDDPFARNETLELVKLFWALPQNVMRDHFLGLLRSMKQ